MPDNATDKPKFKNPNRIAVADWRKEAGLEDEETYVAELGRLVTDSVCPAMCQHGCEVEPDGKCEHRCPSLLLAIGMV